MKINRIILTFTMLFAIYNYGFAQTPEEINLQSARNQIVKRYLNDLKTADYKDMGEIFEKNGIVISTSHGKLNAKEFFYAFLPTVISANTELHQTFLSNEDANRIAARFHLDFVLKDEEKGNGEYMDEFIFTNNTAKIAAVYMFENLKFVDEIN